VSTGAPITTEVGQDLYDALEAMAWADAALGWPLAIYLDAIALILEETAQVVRTDDAGDDGWSAFADPERCPDSYLYTLAQWAGVRYPRRMSTDDLRALIGPHAPGLWRGTKTAILDAVQRYLTPGGAVYFEERADGDPYHLRIFTYTYDTLDQAAIEAELLQHVPAGLILDYEVREGQTYGMLRDTGDTYAAVKAAFATYADVKAAAPSV
jgi:hypothetical protein